MFSKRFRNFVAILRLRTLNMTTDQNKSQAKRYPKFVNFGEYLFWSYANLQLLCAALNKDLAIEVKNSHGSRGSRTSA